jgi:hypothetical protein
MPLRQVEGSNDTWPFLNLQTPAASQLCDCQQVPGSSALVSAEQVPFTAPLQFMHVPLHAWLQQYPSTQTTEDWHSMQPPYLQSDPHTLPCGFFGLQVASFAQYRSSAHEYTLLQAVGQPAEVPSHWKG